MSRKSSRQSRAPRKPAAPRAPGATATSARSARPIAAAAPVAAATYDDNLPATYKHVARDLRRILVLGVAMFALIYASTLVANSLGSNFVIDIFR